jgi:hypothetical protein
VEAFLGTWDYEYGSPQAAVEDFMQSSPQNIESAAAGIRYLLTTFPGEAERLGALREIRFPYMPERSEDVDSFLLWAEQELHRSLPT